MSAERMTSPLSGELPVFDDERGVDVQQKHDAVAEFLSEHRYDALLLEQPQNIAWFTAGGDFSRAGSSETTGALFITSDARVVATNNVDSPQIFELEVPGLGFQLKERAWFEPRQTLLEDLCRGRTVAGDVGRADVDDVSPHLTRMRIVLSELERGRMRQIGRVVAHAIEAVARNCREGQTEARIAGEVSHRLLKHNVLPERIQVASDGRRQRHPHWTFSQNPVESTCVISAVGRRWGLCAGAARTFCFGDPDREFLAVHHRMMLVQATAMYFSRAGWEIGDVWNRTARIYEKFGHQDEWRKANQGELIGYNPTELSIIPRSEYELRPGMAIHWHAGIGPAAAGDTILVTEKGYEWLTPMEGWPKVTVAVKGKPVVAPDILRRRGDDRLAGDSVLFMDVKTPEDHSARDLDARQATHNRENGNGALDLNHDRAANVDASNSVLDH